MPLEESQCSRKIRINPMFPAILAASDRLRGHALSGPGTYTIEATRFGGRGEYVLALEKFEG